MLKTKNYNLNKPEASEQYNIKHFNDNADAIDKALDDIVKGNTPVQKVASNATKNGAEVATLNSLVTQAKYLRKNVIPEKDCNKIIESGVYGDFNCKNFPEPDKVYTVFHITHVTTESERWCTQIAFEDNFPSKSFIRSQKKGVWEDTWKELATTDKTYYGLTRITEDNKDLNTYTEEGTYCKSGIFATSTGTDHVPIGTGDPFILRVSKNGGDYIEEQEVTYTSSNHKEAFRRIKVGKEWRDWQQIATTKGSVESLKDSATMETAGTSDNSIMNKASTITNISTEFKRRMKFNKDTGELTIDLN